MKVIPWRLLILILTFPPISCGVRHPAWQLLQHHYPCSQWHLLWFQGGDQLSPGIPHGGTSSAHLLGQWSMEQRPAALHQAGALHSAHCRAHSSCALIGGHAPALQAQGRQLHHQPHPLPPTSGLHSEQRHQQFHQHSGHVSQSQSHAGGDQRRMWVECKVWG